LEEAMAVSYSKLWKVLIDKEMSKADLRRKADISSNTMTRMRKNEPVTLDLLSRICKELNVDFGDIVSYVPDEQSKI
jgi:DNA-binding Xre family transcriptional regulator